MNLYDTVNTFRTFGCVHNIFPEKELVMREWVFQNPQFLKGNTLLKKHVIKQRIAGNNRKYLNTKFFKFVHY